MNHALTDTVMPQIKKARERDTVAAVFEMKRMMVTLDEIKETSTDPELRSRIDQLKMDMEEVAVRLMVSE
jgi:hypothetical protein